MKYTKRAGIMQINIYKKEKIEKIKKIGLNGENYNCLRILLVQILKMY